MKKQCLSPIGPDYNDLDTLGHVLSENICSILMTRSYSSAAQNILTFGGAACVIIALGLLKFPEPMYWTLKVSQERCISSYQ